MFLALALLRCLERHWTVLLQTGAAEVLIFNSNGVYALPLPVDLRILRKGLPRTTWCLVDSNTALESVPDHILNLDLFLIQATSPRSNSFRGRQSGALVIVVTSSIPCLSTRRS